jgi:hypothetical protein
MDKVVDLSIGLRSGPDEGLLGLVLTHREAGAGTDLGRLGYRGRTTRY